MLPEFVARKGGSQWQSALPTRPNRKKSTARMRSGVIRK